MKIDYQKKAELKLLKRISRLNACKLKAIHLGQWEKIRRLN